MLVASANSWFIAWLAIEINLLSFIPLILKNKNKISSEASLKYFLTQAIASVYIIIAILMLQADIKIRLFIISLALFLKIGAAPLHQWVPRIVEGLTWRTIFVLFIIQKLNPIILISVTVNNFYTLLLIIIVSSCLVGRVGGLIHSSIRKIIAYSSIRHLRWILTSILMKKSLWVTYFTLYSLILLSLFIILDSNQIYFVNQIILKSKFDLLFLSRASLLSLGGLPPFTGFLPKMLISIELIKTENFFLLAILLSGTFISLFFYTRILLANLINTSSSNLIFINKIQNKQTINFFNLFILIGPTLITIFILNFKLYKLKTFKVLKMGILKFNEF